MDVDRGLTISYVPNRMETGSARGADGAGELRDRLRDYVDKVYEALGVVKPELWRVSE